MAFQFSLGIALVCVKDPEIAKLLAPNAGLERNQKSGREVHTLVRFGEHSLYAS
jgi:hypothetical protein